ncbi:MAG TPA: hypothetical protein PKY59_13355 [Pyrinomonadaceae bacterium]|nr:hypothetical protein [Pyrinomonadaceae bacterium]
MKLKICERCKRPFLETKEFCPNCPEVFTQNRESWANMGCLIAMIMPIIFIIFFWIFLFLGFLFR